MARTKAKARRLQSKARAEAAKEPQKPRRWRPGTVALREIRKFQKSTDLLIKTAPMKRIVADIIRANHGDMRIQAKALPVLMEATQALQVQLFKESQLACIHAKRQMINVSDLRYACHVLKLECPTKEERAISHKQLQAKLRAAAEAKARKQRAKLAAEAAADADLHEDYDSEATVLEEASGGADNA